MNLFTKFYFFLKDLFEARKNIFHSGKISSYYILRFLYYISDGLFLSFIARLIKTPHNPRKFKNSYQYLKNIDNIEVKKIKEEILKMNIYTNEKHIQNKPINFVDNFSSSSINYDFYKQNNVVRLNFSRYDLLSNKIISNFIIQNDYSKTIENIIGAPTFLTAVDSWISLSVPKIDENYESMTKFEETQRWHRDVDNLRDLKVFIYLTDVITDEDGPFEIVEGTNFFNFFNPKNYIDKIKFRVSNKFITLNYKNRIKSFFGKEGTTFLADTRAFHRGKPIQKNKYRFVFQFYYSTHLFGNNKKIDLNKNFDSYEMWEHQLKQNKFNSLFNKI